MKWPPDSSTPIPPLADNNGDTVQVERPGTPVRRRLRTAGGTCVGQTGVMVHESIHVSTTIDCPAGDVYDYASNPRNLSTWAAGLAHQEVQLIDGQWVVDSPMGRVIVAFAPSNDFGVLDHDVTLPDGETVRNPMPGDPQRRRLRRGLHGPPATRYE